MVLPIPDAKLTDGNADPAERVVSRETARLAFVAALQQLTPRERAALILRDVLQHSAAETTELLDRIGGPTARTKVHDRPGIPGGMPGVEVGTVTTVFTVDAALQHTCAIVREKANQGDISPAERDLLIDGAILLAMHVNELAQDGCVGWHSGWAGSAVAEPAGRHELQAAAAAA